MMLLYHNHIESTTLLGMLYLFILLTVGKIKYAIIIFSLQVEREGKIPEEVILDID